MNPLTGKHILILGLGASGLAMARWCGRAGAKVTVADTRAAPPQLAALRADLPGAVFVHAVLDETLLAAGTFDLILKSPGLSPASVAGLTAAAAACGLPCSGELDLFAQALAELKQAQGYTPQVIGVTGTNGKTTVTSLTGLLVQAAGRSVAVAGNIGPTLLGTLADKLDAQPDGGALPEVWVLELSSFQLDASRSFEP
ncbi:MAG: UDP-N-acetylmuramoyl-L-alanine--D-glutamate ligase, partial [Polaromonas sp. 39-63-203]